MGLRVGILTGGGDAPGLNAVIRAVVRRASHVEGAEILGVMNGWRGLIEDDVRPLTRNSVTGILPRGGTILGTSRVNPEDDPAYLRSIQASWAKHHLDALVVVGRQRDDPPFKGDLLVAQEESVDLALDQLDRILQRCVVRRRHARGSVEISEPSSRVNSPPPNCPSLNATHDRGAEVRSRQLPCVE